jgi:hypothetical protein
LPPASGECRVATLAREWTRGIPQGPAQVEAICDHLRSEYLIRPAAEAAEDEDHTVEEFLSRPSYLFASSAALMLRELGCPTRLATGFYASPDAYDRSGKQTIVTGEHAHVWVEVCFDGKTWQPVEPTPGFDLLSPPRSLWAMAWATGVEAIEMLRRHSFLCLSALAGLICLWFVRRWAIDLAATLAWQALVLVLPRRLAIPLTLRLLCLRIWLAGHRREKGTPVLRWIRERANSHAVSENNWTNFMAITGRFLYGRAVQLPDALPPCRAIGWGTRWSTFRRNSLVA